MHIEDLRNIMSQPARTEVSNVPHVNARKNERATEAPSQGEAAAFFAGDYNKRIQRGGQYDKNGTQDETLAEEIARKSDSFSDVQSTKKNLSMAVAGFSVEDLNGAKEEGYDVEDMEPDKISTVIDQIKMHLAMGGADISVMGGLSESEIEDMTGNSQALSSLVESALQAADLPADEEIVADGVLAMQKAGEVEEITPQAMEYLLNNELEPTIENVYRASFSRQSFDVPASPLSDEDFNMLLDDAKRRVDAADLVMDETQESNIRWMLDKDIPITKENISYLNELQSEDIDLSPKKVIDRITDAVSEGKKPQEAYLIDGYSMSDKADIVNETISNVTDEQAGRVMEKGEELTPANLRRQMIREERGLENPEVNKDDYDTDAAAKIANENNAAEAINDNSAVETENIALDGTDASRLSGTAVKAARLLEETRLVMSYQANLSLLKQGISIDTTELSELVDNLKSLEIRFESTMLIESTEVIEISTDAADGPDNSALEDELSIRKELYDNTLLRTAQLKEMPAVLLGRIPDISHATLDQLHREGTRLAQDFARMEERYETVGTEVRRDLGDSIKKAFRNVDDILEDIDIEPTEQDRRAVRILAYNQQVITRESVLEIKNSDEMVSRVLKNLTPSVVANMIREGENPLDLSMTELEEKSESIKAVSSSDSAEGKFSEFLFKAQQNGDFSQEERDAFVGVYRLIYQVEKTDGAVIGQLLAQGADITLRNLMTAVRTRRHENRQYTIDDDFGFAEFDKSVLSITDQIEMAFQTKRMKDAGEFITPGKLQSLGEDSYMDMTPDSFAEALSEMAETAEDERLQKEYDTRTRDNIARAVQAEERVYEMLSHFDLPQSPGNLEAFSSMLADRNGMYRRLFGRNDRSVFGTEDEGVREGNTGLDDVIADLIEDFGEAIRSPEEMEEAQQNLEKVAENVMKTMLVEEPAGTIDVRGMQISIKQIRTMGQLGRRAETYSVPVSTRDGIGNMTLKIQRGSEENRGIVDMVMSMASLGTVRASFRYESDGVYGTVTTTLSATLNSIRGISEELSASLEREAGVPANLTFRQDNGLKDDAIYYDEQQGYAAASDDADRPVVQTRVLYGIARTFVQSVSEWA